MDWVIVLACRVHLDNIDATFSIKVNAMLKIIRLTLKM